MSPSRPHPPATGLAWVPAPRAGAPLPSALEGIAALTRAHSRAVLGRDDLATTARQLEAWSQDPTTRRAHLVLARDEASGLPPADAAGHTGDAPVATRDVPADDVLAFLTVAAPLRDNLHLLEAEIQVAPGLAGQGIEELLVHRAESVARSWGRTTLSIWTDSPHWSTPGSPEVVAGVGTPMPGTPGPHQVSPVPSALAGALTHSGYLPVHTEWVMALEVSTAAQEDTRPVTGYETLTWASPSTPPAMHDELARIYALASTDMPSGAMSEEAELWDARRVLDKESLAERAGQDWLVTAVRPVGGELVGWTTLTLTPDLPEVACQSGTLVRADHRGRGLATWLKRVNLRALGTHHPGVRRVLTWNDGANTPVVAMNTRLGFRPELLSVCWERTPTPTATDGSGR